MQPHGCPRRIRILTLDRVQDRLVLQMSQLPELAQIRRTAFSSIDPVTWNHRAAQVLHDFTEADVAGGFGDQQMKASIGLDATVVVVQ